MLENLLNEAELDPATQLEIHEQLQALQAPDIDDDEQKKRWGRLKKLAPDAWEESGVRAIVESVASAAIRAGLGI